MQTTTSSEGQPPKSKSELALFIIFGVAGAAGVGINVLYFLWAGPANRMRKGVCDTAQLEMVYNTYIMVAGNLEKLLEKYREAKDKEKRDEILKAIESILSKFSEKGNLLEFTKELVELIEHTAEPSEENIPKIETIMENLKGVLMKMKEMQEINEKLPALKK